MPTNTVERQPVADALRATYRAEEDTEYEELGELGGCTKLPKLHYEEQFYQ